MATSSNAKIQFESGQTVHDYAAMTDSGDHTIFTISGGTVFSGKSGYEPIIRPNGVASGYNMVSPHADADKVTIAGFTCYIAGVLTTVAATTATITRAETDVAQVHSITVNSSGAIVVVEGEDSASAALSTTRGAAGGPPSIPLASIEIAQIRLTGNTPAVIDADEIFQVDGDGCERYDSPAWEVNHVGDGDAATVAAKKNAYVELYDALPMIHGAVATDAADSYRPIYIRYYSPVLSDLQKSFDFSPAEQSHSVTSTQVYGNKSVGASSSILGQAGFTGLLNDGVTDALKRAQDSIVTVKHFPDRNKSAYSLTQGKLGIKTTYPVADQNKAVCTVTAETATAYFAS